MSSARLAVVDDDQQFAEYLQVWLTSRGYDATTYHSGDALLTGLRDGDQPDVILLDVSMPAHGRPADAARDPPGAPHVACADAVGRPRPGHDCRGRAARRRRLRGEAGRRRAASARWPSRPPSATRSSAQSLATEVTRLRTQAQTRSRRAAALLEFRPGHAARDDDGRPRGRQRRQRAAARRERRRQGSDRPRDCTGGRRAAPQPFVKVNCAALPADLLESELFGHERGAFTGAATTRVGKFEFAQHGTIMLDEIGEMPQALQAKILHVLQDREFTKLGSNRTVDDRRAGHCRHQPRPRGDDEPGHLPGRPVLPAAGDRAARPAACVSAAKRSSRSSTTSC